MNLKENKMYIKNGIFGIIMICSLFSSCIKNKKPDIEKVVTEETVVQEEKYYSVEKPDNQESVVYEKNIEEYNPFENLKQMESVGNDWTIELGLTYRFKPGTYYLLDGVVNVRSEPNLSGSVIGQLDINSQVNIIECSFNAQIIDDVSAYWYKIEHNNSYGYIWGGYIAVETLVYDIDNNGVNDYFHYRFSGISGRTAGFKNITNGFSDVFVYINSKKISLELGGNYQFLDEYNDINRYIYIWDSCTFFEAKKDSEYTSFDGVIIDLYNRSESFIVIYGIDPNGFQQILRTIQK
jgi:hypothetical protein